MSTSAFRLLVGVCFVITGATGLLYQVVWSRYLTLSFGSAQYSVATVVAAYMLGLGGGSYIFGRIADRIARPARLYAFLELGVAAYALASPIVLWLVERAFVLFHRTFDPGPGTATVVKLLLSLLILSVPTAFMGGTLPVLTRALVRSDSPAARDTGRLYALNTLGAMAGTALAGFVLVERLGLFRSLILGAAANAAVGLVFLVVAGNRTAPTPPAEHRPRLRELLSGGLVRVALAASFFSGFAALVDEIVWTRVLGLIVGSSTYAFSLILVSFLLGIGLGSLISARLSAASAARRLAWAQVLAAAGATLMLLLFEPATRAVLIAAQNPLASWWELLLTRGAVAVVAVVPATIGFGATFPALVALAARNARSAGAHVGILYAVNTVGSILGALAGGFLLLHYFSSDAVLRAGVLTSLAIAATAIVIAWREGGRQSLALPAVAGGLVLGALTALPPWPPFLFDVGAAIYGRNQLADDHVLFNHLHRGVNQVVFLREGPISTVTIRDAGYARFLRVNGKSDASSAADMGTQIATGLIPSFAHPAPKTALIIGAGSGVTSRVVASMPGIESVDMIEIEPAVIEAGRYFEDVIGDVYSRIHIIYEDGRNFLLTSQQSYDLIISEPSNPWMGGVASLFTREYYALVSAHLADRGIFCQWLQRYDLSDRTVRRLMATVVASFPHIQLWRAGPGDTFFLASRSPIVLDRSRVRAALAQAEAARPGELADHLELASEEDVAGLYVLGGEGLAALAAGFDPYDDDPPELEFQAFRELYGDPRWQFLSTARILTLKQQLGDGAPDARPPYPPATRSYGFARLLLAWGATEEAVTMFTRSLADQPTAHAAHWLGEAHLENDAPAEAAAAWQRARELDPQSALSALRLAQQALASGDLEGLEELLAIARAGANEAEVRLLEAQAAMAAGDSAAALAAGAQVAVLLEGQKDPMSIFRRLLPIYDQAARAGAVEEVVEALTANLNRAPRLVEWRLVLTDLLEQFGRPAEALAMHADLERRGVRVEDGLLRQARCLLELDRHVEARAVLAELERREPWRIELGELGEQLR